MGVLWNVFQCWRQKHDIRDHIAVLLNKLSREDLHIEECGVENISRDASRYMSILYHNKGIDMINLLI